MSLYPTFKNMTLYASIVLILLGLLLPFTYGSNPPMELIMIIIGMILSFLSLVLSVAVTKLEKEKMDIDSLIFHNSLTYVVIIGNVFLLGYLLQPLPELVESIIIDVGLIMGLFIVLMYFWNFMRLKLGILDVELDIDFGKSSEKDKIPGFLITTLILGGIFSLIYVLFKILYLFVGYALTCIIFIIIIAAFVFTISLIIFHTKKAQ